MQLTWIKKCSVPSSRAENLKIDPRDPKSISLVKAVDGQQVSAASGEALSRILFSSDNVDLTALLSVGSGIPASGMKAPSFSWPSDVVSTPVDGSVVAVSNPWASARKEGPVSHAPSLPVAPAPVMASNPWAAAASTSPEATPVMASNPWAAAPSNSEATPVMASNPWAAAASVSPEATPVMASNPWAATTFASPMDTSTPAVTASPWAAQSSWTAPPPPTSWTAQPPPVPQQVKYGYQVHHSAPVGQQASPPQTAAGFGAPPAAGFGAPPAAGFGAPPAAGFGAPPAAGFGAPPPLPPSNLPPPPPTAAPRWTGSSGSWGGSAGGSGGW